MSSEPLTYATDANVNVDNFTVTNNVIINNSVTLNESEFKQLDGVTLGTAAANKLVTLDSSSNVTGINNLTLTETLTAKLSGSTATTAERTANTTEGSLTYDTDLDKLHARNSSNWNALTIKPSVPSYDFSDYSYNELKAYLLTLQKEPANATYNAYAHGITAVNYAYTGGIYCPIKNRIYFTPEYQATQANWHYINCDTAVVTAYAHGVTAVHRAYAGAAYSPTQKRIYLAPFFQSNQTNWHYIDCATGVVTAYAQGLTVGSDGYQSGVFSPNQNRIYLCPFAEADAVNWVYIGDVSDADTNTVLMSGALFNKL